MVATFERRRALIYTAHATGARIPSFLIDTCVVFFSTLEIEQELERVLRSIAEADDGLRRLYRAINSRTTSRQPCTSRLNFGGSHLTPALITAPRALKLYQTVYSLKTRRRSFHTFTRPLFLNDSTVCFIFISNGMERFF